MKKVPVLEIFGPTIQGEGMVIGQKTMFVRTSGCDYRCSWCDSAFTWDGSQKPDMMKTDEIVDRLNDLAPGRYSHVTISGGNPALHEGIGHLVQTLKQQGIKTAVETQGSTWQEWMLDIDEVTLSPKPPSSNMKTNWQQLDFYVERLKEEGKGQASFKIVIFDIEDLKYALAVHQRYPHIPFFLQAGNEDVKEADDQSVRDRLLTKYEWLVDTVTKSEDFNNVKVLPQLHALLWGNKQGV
ncbi:7-carboxy-7-deazaguanine synthase QueE [Thalassobacillus sp. C254]|uniref:7-carboxy-7-deazaguanine synthase QueE n=1 Tax=Thalassobacillus sp. C254 TaxID=1225341 RepID=UPI0006D0D367|nr:7-carboxy-7-deazaguanine synthase QueE [Thalassobacillus sp. C254]